MWTGTVVALVLVGKDACEEDWMENNIFQPLLPSGCTLLGVPSFARFRRYEFGEFPGPAWAVGRYSSGPPAGGTPQILNDKTLRMTSRLRVQC